LQDDNNAAGLGRNLGSSHVKTPETAKLADQCSALPAPRLLDLSTGCVTDY